MIAPDVIRSAGSGISATPAVAPPPFPKNSFGQIDVAALFAEVKALAQTDPAGALARYAQADGALGAVDRGALARLVGADVDIPGLPGLPGLPLPSLPDLPHLPNPIDILKDGIDKVGHGIDALQDAAHEAKERLEKLPHAIADKVADGMRGNRLRALTSGETAAVQAAFGDRVDLSRVRFVDGPGNSPIARVAFARGNPAITVGNTVYFKPGHFSTDFAATAKGRNTLVHELTHVVQYKEMGYAAFLKQYGADMKRVGDNADKLYEYKSRNTTYVTETLEGKAQMVGDYTEIRTSKALADRHDIADLERRLANTGIYGL